jgi:oxygen-independent coproporphyrinogen-3 oxidase
MDNTQLIRKYNVPGPRYTSYPTVPFWNSLPPTEGQWKESILETFALFNDTEGMSIYVHLPYCESLCTYCGCNTRITVNHAVEKPYIDAVLKEWQMILATLPEVPCIREIHLGGGTPTFFSPENLKLLIDGLLVNAELTEDYEFSFEGHPANTTREHLQMLYNLGFRRVSYGIQDFDPKVQEVIHRIQPEALVNEAVKNAREVGYTSINFDLIYGLPLQTLNSVVNTVNKVLALRPDRIAFYSYAHVPWMKPGQRKFTELDLPDNETKRLLYETGRQMLEAGGYAEVGMDHFALKDDELYLAAQRQDLHRNFMGYTTNHTHMMVGLGASAISDSWLCFVQNEKTVEGYLNAINSGKMPIYRGHMLTEEDLILRHHILNLMCRFETTWHDEDEQCEALYAGLGRLDEMQSDGLLVLDPFKLQVTEKGKMFVRNVCMAFDAELWRMSPKQVMFSKTI